MPFKSKEQERYLQINEPEIYQDWVEKYGHFKGAESFGADFSLEDGQEIPNLTIDEWTEVSKALGKVGTFHNWRHERGDGEGGNGTTLVVNKRHGVFGRRNKYECDSCGNEYSFSMFPDGFNKHEPISFCEYCLDKEGGEDVYGAESFNPHVVQKSSKATRFTPSSKLRTGAFRTKEEAQEYRKLLKNKGHGKFGQSLRVVKANKYDPKMETFGKNAKGEYFRDWQAESFGAEECVSCDTPDGYWRGLPLCSSSGEELCISCCACNMCRSKWNMLELGEQKAESFSAEGDYEPSFDSLEERIEWMEFAVNDKFLHQYEDDYSNVVLDIEEWNESNGNNFKLSNLVKQYKNKTDWMDAESFGAEVLSIVNPSGRSENDDPRKLYVSIGFRDGEIYRGYVELDSEYEMDEEGYERKKAESFNSYKVAPDLSSYTKAELVSSIAGPQGTAAYDEVVYDPIAQSRLSAESIDSFSPARLIVLGASIGVALGLYNTRRD